MFSAWPIRVVVRSLGLLVLLFLSAVPVFAQGDTLKNCLDPHQATFQADSVQEETDVSLADPSELIYGAVACAQTTAIELFLPLARNLLGAFAIIILVWTGVQMMFQGGLDMGSLLSTILSIALPFMILDGYGAGSYIWGDFAFTDIFVGTARWASQALIDESFNSFVVQLTAMWDEVKTALTASPGNVASGLVGAFMAIFAAWFVGFFAVGVLIMILTPPVMLYCQYLWGLVTMLVAILLGPIFVPFLLIPQLSFLFWGWIKSLFGGMIHSIVAAGLFVLIANIMLLPIQSFVTLIAAPNTPFYEAIASGFALLLLYVPIVMLAYMVSFRVSEITGMVLGGGVPSAGLADAVSGFKPRGAKTAGGA